MNSEAEPLKQCSKGREWKPVSEFYVKDKFTGRLFAWCKAHHKEKQQHPRPVIVAGEPRGCRCCGAVKPFGAFRTGRWNCKLCEYQQSLKTSAARSARYNDKHRAERAEVAREKYRANRIALSTRARELRVANPDISRTAVKNWRVKNPEACKIMWMRRRALKRAAEGEFSLEEWNDLKARYDFTCLWCRKREPSVVLSPDHIIALSRGGSNWIDNIQPLCCSVLGKRTGCQYKKRSKNHDFRVYWPGPVPAMPVFE